MFVPGKIVKKVELKNGFSVDIRYPRWEDLDAILEYINTLVQEEPYILLDNKPISRQEEVEYLAESFKAMEKGDKLILVADVARKIVSISDVQRKNNFKKERHIGTLGISVAQEYRGLGIGQAMLETLLKESAQIIAGLKMITLDVFSENQPAINLYKKIGFKEFGRLKKGVFYKGRYIDRIEMVYYLFDRSD